MKDPKTDAVQFSNDARAWLHQFLDFNYFYQVSDITPYIHVLVYYIPEMMHIHHHFGLAAFLCSAVEKKNHQQVSYFFKKTTKDGGTGKGRKSTIVDILEHEIGFYILINMAKLIQFNYQNVYASSKNKTRICKFFYIFFMSYILMDYNKNFKDFDLLENNILLKVEC